jgi:hypothetical protein
MRYFVFFAALLASMNLLFFPAFCSAATCQWINSIAGVGSPVEAPPGGTASGALGRQHAVFDDQCNIIERIYTYSSPDQHYYGFIEAGTGPQPDLMYSHHNSEAVCFECDEPMTDEPIGSLTYDEYIDIAHGFAGIVCAGIFSTAILRR